MHELLNKYIAEDEIEKAIVVGRNIVNKTPNNKEGIDTFVNFLFGLSENLPALQERKDYLEQAKIVISFVEENADLTADYLNWIVTLSDRAIEIERKISKSEDEKINKIVSDIEFANNQILMKIHNLCEQLKLVQDQESFDSILVDFIDNDRKLEKDYLTADDQKDYDNISKLCSDLISKKMQELEHNSNIEYNEQALDDYHAAFVEFSNNETRYKDNLDQLMTMLQSRLFKYDSSRIFSETATYYQYVYAQIFEKLTNEGKLLLTKTSIEAGKRQNQE